MTNLQKTSDQMQRIAARQHELEDRYRDVSTGVGSHIGSAGERAATMEMLRVQLEGLEADLQAQQKQRLLTRAQGSEPTTPAVARQQDTQRSRYPGGAPHVIVALSALGATFAGMFTIGAFSYGGFWAALAVGAISAVGAIAWISRRAARTRTAEARKRVTAAPEE
jgi:hypothetical protein